MNRRLAMSIAISAVPTGIMPRLHHADRQRLEALLRLLRWR